MTRKIISVLAGLICTAAFEMVILFTGVSSFSYTNGLKLLAKEETMGALRNELNYELEQSLAKLNLEIDPEGIFLEEEIIDYLSAAEGEAAELPVSQRIEDAVLKLYESHGWQAKNEKISEFASQAQLNAESSLDHHLIKLIETLNISIPSKITIFTLAAGLAAVILLIFVDRKRIGSVLTALFGMNSILGLLLSLPFIKRITIGYGVESAYLLFQGMLKQFRNTFIAAALLCLILLLVFRMVKFRQPKKQKKIIA